MVRPGPVGADGELRPHRLPASLGPEGLLGHQGHDQHHGRGPALRPVSQNDRGRGHGVRQPDDHPPLRPARGHPADPDDPLPLGPRDACPAARADASRTTGAVGRRDLLAGADLQKRCLPEHRCGNHGLPGSDQGRCSARRAGRSLELRLPGPARVVLPLPLPDAQALPGPPRVGRLDRHPLDHSPGPVPAAAAGPDLALEVPPFSRVCRGVWAAGRRRLLDRRGPQVRRGRHAVSGSQAEGRCGPRAGTFPRGEPRGRHPAGRSRVPACGTTR